MEFLALIDKSRLPRPYIYLWFMFLQHSIVIAILTTALTLRHIFLQWTHHCRKIRPCAEKRFVYLTLVTENRVKTGDASTVWHQKKLFLLESVGLCHAITQTCNNRSNVFRSWNWESVSKRIFISDLPNFIIFITRSIYVYSIETQIPITADAGVKTRYSAWTLNVCKIVTCRWRDERK